MLDVWGHTYFLAPGAEKWKIDFEIDSISKFTKTYMVCTTVRKRACAGCVFINFQNSKIMLTLPEGCTKVAKNEIANILPNCGSKTSTLFFPGDIVKINEDVYTKIFKSEGSDKEIPVAYVHCKVNEAEQVISFSSFRRFPKDVDAFIKKAPFHRNLFNGSDYDRYLYLKGKTLVVDSIYEGETIDWKLSDIDAKNYVFKTSKFPIFKEKK